MMKSFSIRASSVEINAQESSHVQSTGVLGFDDRRIDRDCDGRDRRPPLQAESEGRTSESGSV